jgi:hypothetical protein
MARVWPEPSPSSVSFRQKNPPPFLPWGRRADFFYMIIVSFTVSRQGAPRFDAGTFRGSTSGQKEAVRRRRHRFGSSVLKKD